MKLNYEFSGSFVLFSVPSWGSCPFCSKVCHFFVKDVDSVSKMLGASKMLD